MLHYFERFSNFVKRQSHNFLILMVKSIGNDFIKGISTQYTSLYQRALGANLLQLGLLNSIDAVSKDYFAPYGTCGKGDPAQGLNVSIGGPHVRLRDIRLGGDSS